MADYIVPAVLQQLGVLKYSSTLAKLIEANNEIDSGSEEEVELRACSIYAVEKMKELISEKSGKQVWLNSFDIASNLVIVYFFWYFNEFLFLFRSIRVLLSFFFCQSTYNISLCFLCFVFPIILLLLLLLLFI